MSESILANLKIKPLPKEKQSIEIIIKKPAGEKEDIIIKTKIIDKTKENIIDRSIFLKKVKSKSEIFNKNLSPIDSIDKSKSIESKKKELDKIKKQRESFGVYDSSSSAKDAADFLKKFSKEKK